MDLLLTNVHVTAHVTLGIPILTGPDAQAARDAATDEHATDRHSEDDTALAGTESITTGSTDDSAPAADQHAQAAAAAGPSTTDTCDPRWVRPAFATGGLGTGGSFSISAALISGCEIPGIGWVDAETVENLLSIVPTDIGRALLDARTGTLIESLSAAYRPSKTLTEFVTTRDGTCRMWGCTRPARRCDIDHARPWPNGPTTPANLGGLCRRHHRLKQRRRWTYHLDPDGTATWTSPNGTTRITPPDHTTLLPPRPSAPALVDDETARVLVDDLPPF